MDLERSTKELREKLALAEHIEKTGGKYELVSHSGKDLGKYSSKAGAEKREKQVEYFKHAKESEEDNPYHRLGKLSERVLDEAKKAKGGGKDKSTKFGRIYGSEVGKGKSNDEAAAIAYYYTKGDK